MYKMEQPKPSLYFILFMHNSCNVYMTGHRSLGHTVPRSALFTTANNYQFYYIIIRKR